KLSSELISDVSHAQFSMLDSQLLRPWLLPAVYERHQAGLGDFLTELRPAVALFIQFRGIDYVDDADAGIKLDAFIRLVQATLTRYSGALIQLTIGDKGSYLQATFGAPIAHEDDPRRAARAALALLALPEQLAFLSPLQAGISHGVLRVGAYGGARARAPVAVGGDGALAARVRQPAGPGRPRTHPG